MQFCSVYGPKPFLCTEKWAYTTKTAKFFFFFRKAASYFPNSLDEVRNLKV